MLARKHVFGAKGSAAQRADAAQTAQSSDARNFASHWYQKPGRAGLLMKRAGLPSASIKCVLAREVTKPFCSHSGAERLSYLLLLCVFAAFEQFLPLLVDVLLRGFERPLVAGLETMLEATL